MKDLTVIVLVSDAVLLVVLIVFIFNYRKTR